MNEKSKNCSCHAWFTVYSGCIKYPIMRFTFFLLLLFSVLLYFLQALQLKRRLHFNLKLLDRYKIVLMLCRKGILFKLITQNGTIEKIRTFKKCSVRIEEKMAYRFVLIIMKCVVLPSEARQNFFR